MLELNIRNESQSNQQNSEMCRSKAQWSSRNKPLYEFVTWTDPSGNTDAAARKAVRSHAMRHCKPRRDQPNSACRVRHTPDNSIENPSETLEDKFKTYLATMPHGISTLDPFDCLPVQMRPYVLELFNKCKVFLLVTIVFVNNLTIRGIVTLGEVMSL